MTWSPSAFCTHWRLVLAALCLVGASAAHAQTPQSCRESYAQAEEAYYAADFETARALLRPCARETTLSDSARARMYRLLSFVYLGQNDEAPARRAVESLLDLRPDYTPIPGQARPDFVALVREAKAARRAMAKATEDDGRRWVRWTLGVAAAALGTAAVLLLRGGGGDDGGALPPPEAPPE